MRVVVIQQLQENVSPRVPQKVVFAVSVLLE